jgi:hypothetical protein
MSALELHLERRLHWSAEFFGTLTRADVRLARTERGRAQRWRAFVVWYVSSRVLWPAQADWQEVPNGGDVLVNGHSVVKSRNAA